MLRPPSSCSGCRAGQAQASMKFVVTYRGEDGKHWLCWEIKMTPQKPKKWTCCWSSTFSVSSCASVDKSKPSTFPAIPPVQCLKRSFVSYLLMLCMVCASSHFTPTSSLPVWYLSVHYVTHTSRGSAGFNPSPVQAPKSAKIIWTHKRGWPQSSDFIS